MKGTIWTVVIVVVLAGVMFVGVSGQFADATQTEEIVAEEHTLSESDAITLEAADEWSSMVDESEEIRTDEETLTRDEDYTIDYDTGDVTSSEEFDGADVEIDYAYNAVDEDTEAIAAVLGPLAVPIAWFVVIAGVGAILGWIAMLPKGGGSW